MWNKFKRRFPLIGLPCAVSEIAFKSYKELVKLTFRTTGVMFDKYRNEVKKAKKRGKWLFS